MFIFYFFSFVSALQGDRFGGALDAAAKQFSKAFDSGMLPMEFVNKMKKDGKLIMGIGHRVKSVRSRESKMVELSSKDRRINKVTSLEKGRIMLLICVSSDQQSRHESPDPEGLCEAALPLHPAAGLRSGRGEDHHIQGKIHHFYCLFIYFIFLSSLNNDMILSETQLDPERGRLHRCGLRGPAQDV